MLNIKDIENFKSVLTHVFAWNFIVNEEKRFAEKVRKLSTRERLQKVLRKNAQESPEGQAAIKYLVEKYGSYYCEYVDEDSGRCDLGKTSWDYVLIDSDGRPPRDGGEYKISVNDISTHDPKLDIAKAEHAKVVAEKSILESKNTPDSMFIGSLLNAALEHPSSPWAQELLNDVQSAFGETIFWG